jgi:hypothetical protein
MRSLAGKWQPEPPKRSILLADLSNSLTGWYAVLSLHTISYQLGADSDEHQVEVFHLASNDVLALFTLSLCGK